MLTNFKYSSAILYKSMTTVQLWKCLTEGFLILGIAFLAIKGTLRYFLNI